MAHAYTPEAIQRCIRLGVKCIEHGNLLDEEAARCMKSAGACLIIAQCPYMVIITN